ncbi:MAG: Fur family transcriptional regulator [Solirubrobacteraceae bacterium]
MNNLERLAWQHGLRVSSKRRVILQVLEEAAERLSAREIRERALRLDQHISLATVYVTLRKLLAAELVIRTPATDRSMWYQKAVSQLTKRVIDVRTGRVRDFDGNQIALMLQEVAHELGYRLLDYRLELFGTAECAAGAPRISILRQAPPDGRDPKFPAARAAVRMSTAAKTAHRRRQR